MAAEVSRRVSSILDVVEREAAALRQEAKDEARRYMEYARRRADGLVAERQREIAELSGSIMERADRLVRQLDEAKTVRAAFEDVVRSLGEAADRLARETGDAGEFVAPAFHETPPAPPLAPRPSEAHPPRHAAPAVSTPPPASREPDTFGPEPTSQRPSWPSPPQPSFSPESPVAAPAPGTRGDGRAERGSLDLKEVRKLVIQMASSGWTRGEVFSHLREAFGMAHPDAIVDEIFGADSAEDTRAAWARPKTGQPDSG